ncbi:MAG: class I SAM-dependent methyltransferase [Planctomycetota bacterium]|nr:class I SAM-dependent methyltransferase [Planctomycetota bacterium]
MDATTEAVREFYELFPYPSGAPTLRMGFDARYLLSLSRKERPMGRPIRVLDAGCSRGVGALGCATLQPDIQVLGVDINRVALEEARGEAQRRDLSNIEFAEVDLSTLEGLEVPEGGFDVITSSGVLHHLADPAEGLRLLKGALAPHGVLALMVYSKSGRRETLEISYVVDALVDKNQGLTEQLADARAVVRRLSELPGATDAWKIAAAVDDVEFVDRYLHIQECVYDVPELFDFINQGGLSFLRWMDPPAWRANAQTIGADLAQRASGLDGMQAARLLDSLGHAPGSMEVYLCHPENGLKSMPQATQLAETVFMVHPEIRFHTMQRNMWCATRVEAVAVERRTEEPVIVAPGVARALALVLRDQNEPFQGQAMFEVLIQEGHSAESVARAFLHAIREEWVYCPHMSELLLS